MKSPCMTCFYDGHQNDTKGERPCFDCLTSVQAYTKYYPIVSGTDLNQIFANKADAYVQHGVYKGNATFEETGTEQAMTVARFVEVVSLLLQERETLIDELISKRIQIDDKDVASQNGVPFEELKRTILLFRGIIIENQKKVLLIEKQKDEFQKSFNENIVNVRKENATLKHTIVNLYERLKNEHLTKIIEDMPWPKALNLQQKPQTPSQT